MQINEVAYKWAGQLTRRTATRRIIQVTPSDAEETSKFFDLLLGDNLAGRKEHIAQHGAEYLDDLDVS